MKRRVLIEGMMPYRALNRLQREQIPLYKVKKYKKNALICTVDEKDIEKIFAIYPNVCYNSGAYTAYTARLLPVFGAHKAWKIFRTRIGLTAGILLFLLLTVSSDKLVLNVEVIGESSYAEEVEGILEKNGVRRFQPYPEEKTDVITAEILRLSGVGFCSVKKVGTTLTVEVHTFPFANGKDEGEDFDEK